MAHSWEDKQARSLKHAEETLEWVRSNGVTATPGNYTLGFEHVSGSNPAISQTLSQLELRGEPLEPRLDALYQQFFGDDDGERLDEFRQALNQVMEQALSATAGTRADLSKYAEHLNHSNTQLNQQADDLELVKSVVEDLVNETQRMEGTVKHLESDLTVATGEIHQLKQQYEQMREEIFADPLTGVLNRRGLDTRLSQLLRDNDEGPQHALLMIDLDNFKPLNDRYGHVVGDQVLCYVAKQLKNSVRGSDAVGRYGGDEFAVILPETTQEGAFRVASNIVGALRKSQLKRRSTGELLGKITASVGVAVCAPEDTPETLTDRADKALYRAKNAGKDSIVNG